MRNKKPPHHPKPQKGAFGNKAKSKSRRNKRNKLFE